MLTIVARLIGFPSADWLVKVFAGRQFRCEVYFPLRSVFSVAMGWRTRCISIDGLSRSPRKRWISGGLACGLLRFIDLMTLRESA